MKSCGSDVTDLSVCKYCCCCQPSVTGNTFRHGVLHFYFRKNAELEQINEMHSSAVRQIQEEHSNTLCKLGKTLAEFERYLSSIKMSGSNDLWNYNNICSLLFCLSTSHCIWQLVWYYSVFVLFFFFFLIALRNVIYSFWVLVKCNDILCNLAEEAVDVSSKMQPSGIPKRSWYSMRVVTSKDGLCTLKYLAVSPAVQAQNQWLSYSSCGSLLSQYSDCSILILILLLLRT